MLKITLSTIAIFLLIAAPAALAAEWRGEKDSEGKQHGAWNQYLPNSEQVVEVVNFRHGARHGPWLAFYVTGNKSITSNYKDGELDGEHITYFDIGENPMSARGNHTNGVRTGTWTDWHPNGQVNSVTNYFNGTLHGSAEFFYASGHKYYTTAYKDGQLQGDHAEFFDNGDNSQKFQGAHTDNLRTGEWTEWHTNGKKKSVLSYFNGKENGPAEHFYPSGQKYFTTTYMNGLHLGDYVEFFDNGDNSQKFQGAHTDNLRTGEWTEWHSNGQKRSVISFFNSKEGGTAKYFHANGYKDYTTTYKEGLHHGPYVEYFNLTHPILGEWNHEKIVGTHTDNVKTGTWTEWHSSLEKKSVITYVNGKENGPAEYFHDDGNRDYTTTYRDGMQHGPYVKYFNFKWLGELKITSMSLKGDYADGKKTGTWQHFDSDEQLKKVSHYSNGELVSEESECLQSESRCEAND